MVILIGVIGSSGSGYGYGSFYQFKSSNDIPYNGICNVFGRTAQVALAVNRTNDILSMQYIGR
jgi:hypothetical protein